MVQSPWCHRFHGLDIGVWNHPEIRNSVSLGCADSEGIFPAHRVCPKVSPCSYATKDKLEDMDVSLHFQTRPRGAITFNLNISKTTWAVTKIIGYSENLGYL